MPQPLLEVIIPMDDDLLCLRLSIAHGKAKKSPWGFHFDCPTHQKKSRFRLIS
jgi:hypothetical protein